MQTGDQVVLRVKRAGESARTVLKELLVTKYGVFAVTTPKTMSDWPDEIQLHPERVELSPAACAGAAVHFYQDDLVEPRSLGRRP